MAYCCSTGARPLPSSSHRMNCVDRRGKLDLNLLHQAGLRQVLGGGYQITMSSPQRRTDLHTGPAEIAVCPFEFVELASQTLPLGQIQLVFLLQQPEVIEYELGLRADGEVAARAAPEGRAEGGAPSSFRWHSQSAQISGRSCVALIPQDFPCGTRLRRDRGAVDNRRCRDQKRGIDGRIGKP